MTVHDDLLVADFTESYQQMRHYDEGFLTRLQFGFGGVLAVIGGTAFLVEHYHATPLVLAASGVLLSLSSGMGSLLVFGLARNRIYFAFVARYVNEIRAFHLSKRPEGLDNKAAMYSDYRLPHIFDPASGQSMDIYFMSLCVSLLVAGAITSFRAAYLVHKGAGVHVNWTLAGSVFIAATSIQLTTVIMYLRSKEKKRTAHGAVHRKPDTKIVKESAS